MPQMEVSPLLEQLFVARNIFGVERQTFLNPEFDTHAHAPTLLDGMEKAVARIFSAIKKGEKIAVYADFDCDGIPGSVVLYDALKKLGVHAEVYIPHRHNEGYGFHRHAIDALQQRGVSLIVTVDVGIAAVEEVAYAQSRGVEVIVTDHHEPQARIPEAVAVINPKLGAYPYRDLCGAAVAFKLVQALFCEARKRGAEDVPEGWEKWLLDMVGIATIADMVPLTGENRVLAHYGLLVLRKSPRPGIQALCRKLRINQRELTEDDIGFSMAPRINAASRMDEPELAFALLTETDGGRAMEIAHTLERLNATRKGVVAALVKDAKHKTKERFSADTKVIVLGDPNWKPALLGLAANSIVEDRGGVVCLWGRDGAGVLKGSCRSDGSTNLAELFAAAGVREALEESGGHANAGGFSVLNEMVHTLPEIFNAAAAQLPRAAIPPVTTDFEVPIEMVSWESYQALSKFAPFGLGNPKPLMRIRDVLLRDVRLFGKDQGHTEFIFDAPQGHVRGFQFFRTPDQFSRPPSPGIRCHVIGTIERDTFRGARSVALRVTNVE